MKIVTLLKSGGEYTKEHVEMLRAQVMRHNPEAEFVCVRDADLDHGWEGWWSKIEVLRMQGPLLFLDLDTVVVGDMSSVFDIVKENKFAILRDVSRGKYNKLAMQSSVMGWGGDVSLLYDIFRIDPEKYIKKYHGDQNFIEDHMATDKTVFFQDVIPNKLQSFKADVRGRGTHPDCKIVFFHGQPRPWQQGELKCQ